MLEIENTDFKKRTKSRGPVFQFSMILLVIIQKNQNSKTIRTLLKVKNNILYLRYLPLFPCLCCFIRSTLFYIFTLTGLILVSLNGQLKNIYDRRNFYGRIVVLILRTIAKLSHPSCIGFVALSSIVHHRGLSCISTIWRFRPYKP